MLLIFSKISLFVLVFITYLSLNSLAVDAASFHEENYFHFSINVCSLEITEK